jgi:hypothetical protein
MSDQLLSEAEMETVAVVETLVANGIMPTDEQLEDFLQAHTKDISNE